MYRNLIIKITEKMQRNLLKARILLSTLYREHTKYKKSFRNQILEKKKKLIKKNFRGNCEEVPEFFPYGGFFHKWGDFSLLMASYGGMWSGNTVIDVQRNHIFSLR